MVKTYELGTIIIPVSDGKAEVWSKLTGGPGVKPRSTGNRSRRIITLLQAVFKNNTKGVF